MTTTQAGAALRALREEAGLTAREVAVRAGVSESYLSRVETGKAVAGSPWIGNVASAIAAAIVETAIPAPLTSKDVA